MKIVILDGYTLNPGDLSWKGVEKLGDVKIYDRTTSNSLETSLIVERVGDAEAILTNKTPLTKETLKQLPNLKYIGVLATGYNVVDVEAAKKLGIIVSNVPAYGTAAVSQTAIALLLEVCHNIGEHNRAVKTGQWSIKGEFSFWNYPLIELKDKTMGIIGFGKTGRSTAKIAQALGMKVLANNRENKESIISDIFEYVKLERLFIESDVIVLHCPLTKITEGLINKNNINKMKDGVIIINNSRGQLVVEKDLAEALESGKVLGAAIDVVSVEPIQDDNPLLTAKNCIITPHLSWAPVESRQRLLETAIDNLKSFISGNPTNVVNK